MKTFFNVIFYKFFQHSKYIGNVDDDNSYAFKAIGIFAIFIFFNVLSLWLFYNILAGQFRLTIPPIFITLLVAFLIGGALYFFFVRKNNYKKVIESLQLKPKLIGKRGTWITIIYMIVSLILSFGTAYLMSFF